MDDFFTVLAHGMRLGMYERLRAPLGGIRVWRAFATPGADGVVHYRYHSALRHAATHRTSPLHLLHHLLGVTILPAARRAGAAWRTDFSCAPLIAARL